LQRHNNTHEAQASKERAIQKKKEKDKEEKKCKKRTARSTPV
jgi:hypothetical protein